MSEKIEFHEIEKLENKEEKKDDKKDDKKTTTDSVFNQSNIVFLVWFLETHIIAYYPVYFISFNKLPNSLPW
jgi:hypothetical protein